MIDYTPVSSTCQKPEELGAKSSSSGTILLLFSVSIRALMLRALVKQRCPHVKLGDVVNSSVTVFIFLIPVLYSITMVEIDEDPQMGFESEEDDDELSDGEVRISCVSCVCSGSAVLHYNSLSCYISQQVGTRSKRVRLHNVCIIRLSLISCKKLSPRVCSNLD